MTQEEKQLLLKDLCARFPYHVICQLSKDGVEITEPLQIGGLGQFMFGRINVKPYLRPMSSMTEEEKSLFLDLRNALTYQENGEYVLDDFIELQDFLNRKHLDYRELIPMGLALEAPDGMYN